MTVARLPSFSLILQGQSKRGQASEALREFCALWDQGERLDAVDFFRQRPEARAQRSNVFDVVYEEYCRLCEAEQPPEPEAFSARFPECQQALLQMLITHGLSKLADELEAHQPDPIWPSIGDSFAGFRLIEEIGRGGFARVYLAHDPALADRPVVLKLTPEGPAEAQTLARLEHPGIVPVFQVLTDRAAGLTGICMPYHGRVTLADVLDRIAAGAGRPASGSALLDAARGMGPEPTGGVAAKAPTAVARGSYPAAIAWIGAELCDALASAHQRQILHRDLKPSNVLIDEAGHPRLLDFNLAYDRRSCRRRLGGTLTYMAPEHLRAAFPPQPPDEPDQGDPRSDVYAMGAMLYEALTGRLPFPGDLTPGARPSAKQLADLDDQQRAGPTGVRQLNRRVDRGLARLVERCLAYDPADRPRSAAELGAALRRNSSSPMARASRWGRIHRGLVAVATTLVCVIALGAAGWRATLEPYAVRQLRAGWAAYDHHDAEGAIDRFQRAIGAADPLSEAQLADAYRGRGQSRMVARQFKEAGEDLFLAYQETKDAKLLDAIVYCNVQTGSNETAIGMANSLLSSSYDSAALRNNLGMAYSRMGLLPDALVSFKAAAEMRPLSGLVMRNLAWCQFKSCVKDRIATTEEMVTEIDRALQSERSPSAELYFNAACIVAWTADAQSRGPEIIEHLRHALARGLRLDRLESDLIPTWLRDEPDFVELTNSPECDGDGAPPQFLVNPLEDGYGIGNLRATEAKKNFAP